MKYTKIIPGYKTDHSAIIFTFATSLAKRDVSIYLSKTTFQSPHDKILVFEKVNTFCNIILNSEGSSVL
jgi:hypothetical protein